MYYKLTMRDKRVLFATLQEVHEKIKQSVDTLHLSPSFGGRLKQLRAHYPDLLDWEMVEPEDVLGIVQAISVQSMTLEEKEDLYWWNQRF